MSLWFDLQVNSETIGRLEIRRLTRRVTSTDPDSINRYVVILDGEEIGQVEHRYGDGPWELVRKALEYICVAQTAIEAQYLGPLGTDGLFPGEKLISRASLSPAESHHLPPSGKNDHGDPDAPQPR